MDFRRPSRGGDRRPGGALISSDIERIARALEAAADGDFRPRARLDPASPLSVIATAADRLIASNAQAAREFARVCRRVGGGGRLSERARASILPGQYADSLPPERSPGPAHLARGRDRRPWRARWSKASSGARCRSRLRRVPRSVGRRCGGPQHERAGLAAARHPDRGDPDRGGGRNRGEAGRASAGARASGAWKELVEAVNLLAANLTSQVRNIALVTTAVARGDLSRKITVPAQGEILELKETVNEMVDQLRAFAAEVTRVAREVGTEGKLGGQADVKGVSGVWKDLTDNGELHGLEPHHAGPQHRPRWSPRWPTAS